MKRMKEIYFVMGIIVLLLIGGVAVAANMRSSEALDGIEKMMEHCEKMMSGKMGDMMNSGMGSMMSGMTTGMSQEEHESHHK
ncbi:hypothetical protein HY498_04595 [Candidatus Woesearchaeota archaeon]|nr:hypothetical protein [Candidatus Woesearchaeota archaeon]